MVSAPSSPSNLSSVTLVGSLGSGSGSDRSPQDFGEIVFSGGAFEGNEDTTVATDDKLRDGMFSIV